jgi:hypothetical protein
MAKFVTTASLKPKKGGKFKKAKVLEAGGESRPHFLGEEGIVLLFRFLSTIMGGIKKTSEVAASTIIARDTSSTNPGTSSVELIVDHNVGRIFGK